MHRLTHGSVATSDLADAGKIISATAAAEMVRDGDTIAVGGGVGESDGVSAALESRFLDKGDFEGRLHGLTLVCATDQGGGRSRGVNYLAHPGLLKRIITGSWSQPPRIRELAATNRIEAYALPQGAIIHMLRAVVAQRSGHVTKVGLGTPADPRRGGGKVSLRTSEDLVRVLFVAGADVLFYKALPINFGLIQGLVADRAGNLAVRRQVAMEVHAIASAAHVSGGTVIAQIERVVPDGGLPADAVVIASALIDHLVITHRADRLWEVFAAPPPLWAGPSKPLSLPSG